MAEPRSQSLSKSFGIPSAEGPRVVLYERSEPDVVFAELEAGLYLDMVVDEGPEHDPGKARHLAGALAILLEGSEQANEFLADLMTLARWKRKAVERLRTYLSGRHDRDAFERFVERRPWSTVVKHAILAMPESDVGSLADYLEAK